MTALDALAEMAADPEKFRAMPEAEVTAKIDAAMEQRFVDCIESMKEFCAESKKTMPPLLDVTVCNVNEVQVAIIPITDRPRKNETSHDLLTAYGKMFGEKKVGTPFFLIMGAEAWQVVRDEDEFKQMVGKPSEQSDAQDVLTVTALSVTGKQLAWRAYVSRDTDGKVTFLGEKRMDADAKNMDNRLLGAFMLGYAATF